MKDGRGLCAAVFRVEMASILFSRIRTSEYSTIRGHVRVKIIALRRSGNSRPLLATRRTNFGVAVKVPIHGHCTVQVRESPHRTAVGRLQLLYQFSELRLKTSPDHTEEPLRRATPE